MSNNKPSMLGTVFNALLIIYVLWWLWQRRWGKCVCFGIMGACAYIIFISGQTGPYIHAVAKHDPGMAYAAAMANLIGLIVFICTYFPWVLIDRARKIEAAKITQTAEREEINKKESEEEKFQKEVQIFKDNPNLLAKKWGEIGGELRALIRKIEHRRVLRTNPAYLEVPKEWKNAVCRGDLQNNDEWKKICNGWIEQDKRD